MILRSMIGRSIEWITDLHLLDLANDSLEKLIMDALFNEDSAGSDAVLSLVEEDTGHGLNRREIHVQIER